MPVDFPKTPPPFKKEDDMGTLEIAFTSQPISKCECT